MILYVNKEITVIFFLSSILSTFQCIQDENYEKDFQNMLSQFHIFLDSQNYCNSQQDMSSRPCFDMTSSQSVLLQLCNRIARLESMFNKLSSHVINNPAKKENPDKILPENETSYELSKLKQELSALKRTSAFSAVKQQKVKKISEKIIDYNVTFNKGTSCGFDYLNGVYHAHYDGVYHFSLKYQKPSQEVELEALLVMDNTILSNSADEKSSRIDTLIQLKTGQKVWANITTNSILEDVQVFLTFSGFYVN